MSAADETRSGDLPAGEFAAWLSAMRAALRHEADSDVPCGDCCACCTTAHFVHVGPDEADALAEIPRDLLFAAPGMPAGHVVLPYDERGRCPLLDAAGRCTIYDHRPRTCRTYDCRVFAAARIDADRDEITARARRWSFACPAPEGAELQAAVAAAARWIRENATAFPGGAVPDDPGQLAVLAVRVAEVFLPGGPAAAVRGADGRESAAGKAAVAAAIVHAAS